MIGKEINIDPKEKTVDIFVDDIDIEQLKDILKDFGSLGDYEFRVHNPGQTTDLISVYEYNVLIDKLYKI